MNMIVAAGTNLCEVLCSLSAGFWPVTTLDLAVEAGQHHQFLVKEVKELVKWNLSVLQELHLVGLGIGSCRQMPEMVHVLSCGHWPNLRKLDLTANVIDDLFAGLLADAKWPMLDHVILVENEIGENGVWQLTHANWPHLTDLDLARNNFNRHDHLFVWSGGEQRLTRLLHARWPGIAINL